MIQEHIKIWRFEDAPEHLKLLSKTEEKKHYLAEVPNIDNFNLLLDALCFYAFSFEHLQHPEKNDWDIIIMYDGEQ